MTNYSSWDAKATALCKEAEEESKREEEENNKALGLGGGPEGPPVAKAQAELTELGEHSKQRKEFIDWSKGREVLLTHTGTEQEPEVVELAGPSLDGKAVRISNSKRVSYVLPQGSGVVKLMVDACSQVRLHLQGSMVTSTVELYKCKELTLELEQPLGTLQVDECLSAVAVMFAECDHVGCIYHQNSPGLTLGWQGQDGASQQIGAAGPQQLVTRLTQGALQTVPVRRGEGEFPLDLGTAAPSSQAEQPEPEAAPAAEERTRLAELQRKQGNDMFRASDFAQAAMFYTTALELDPSQGAVWANRAQCWLKLGDHEKALADSIKCTEVDPANPKGWFRKGMSLHAMKRFGEAIPALLEAEKLEPSNKQVQEAIKMAQLMARRAAS